MSLYVEDARSARMGDGLGLKCRCMFDGVRKGGADTSGANRIDHGVALDFLFMPRLARFGDNSNMEQSPLPSTNPLFPNH